MVDWVDGTIYCGINEYLEMSFVLRVLRPTDPFVDLGAMISSYTALASDVCRAQTVAIEADEEWVTRDSSQWR